MGKNLTSRDVIKIIEKDGWYYHTTVGSHRHYKHPTKKGKVTVKYPAKSFPPKTIRNMEKQSGLIF
jgi:predicted RNA binding protein YcfA (HicA-like mRNA interferase family)